LSFQQASENLPVETCETMNDSWGFNITDRNYKSTKQLIQYVVNAAGRNANFLLNIGPMPNGLVQPEFIDTLKKIGTWMQQYGETIYGTRGRYIPPQEWGVATIKNKTLYLHILNSPQQEGYIFIPELKDKVVKAVKLADKSAMKFKQVPEGVFVYLNGISLDDTDTVVQLDLK
ncbi:MAG: alpha-L-fucosidase, partial [Bacteroidetes bacterium]|nr:alpha-L-fucosidase [Bacteroidota bacterium]